MTTEMAILRMKVKDYEELTKVITGKKQRLTAFYGIEENCEEFDTLLKGEKGMVGLETLKSRVTRDIERELRRKL